MSRITSLNTSTRDMIMELSDGVPGALKVLSSILQNPEAFAPADPVFVILSLDSLEIYGSDIWKLGHYVCKDDMTLLKQVLDNNVRDYLTEDVLKYHIQNNLPFDKLYTRDEMNQDDHFKRKLPLIEPDLAAQLQGNQPSEQITEERADANTAKCGDELELGKEISQFFSKKTTDTSPSMNVFTLIDMLEERGFRLGCESVCTDGKWNDQFSSRVYYHPDQKVLVRLTTPEDGNTPTATLGWFGGTMFAQRNCVPPEIFNFRCFYGPTSVDFEAQGHIFVKNIKNDLFGFYNSLVEKSSPLVSLIPDDMTILQITRMFIPENKSNLDVRCPVDLGYLSTYLPAFFNMTKLEDSGLKEMLAPVIQQMPALLEQEISDLVYGNSFEPHERNEEGINWLMHELGIDHDWFRQHGVDIDLALQPTQNLNFKFRVNNPQIVTPRTFDFFRNVFREFKILTGERTPLSNISWELKNGNSLTIKLERVSIHSNESEAAQAMQSVLQKSGWDVTIEKPPLSFQIQSATFRAAEPHSTDQLPVKEASPER